jgi:hypothetical protein
MALTKEQKRARQIARAIHLAYGSLRSHLQYTYGGKMVRNEDNKFHQKCCKEYAEIIKILTSLY